MRETRRRRWSKLSCLGILACSFAAIHLLVWDIRFLAKREPCSISNNDEKDAPRASLTASKSQFTIHSKRKNMATTTRYDHHVCTEQLRNIFEMHDCLVQTANGGRFPGEEEYMASSNCHQIAAAPVHHLSFMWGQGFGRMVQHGVKTCLLAALLHRPCVIDFIRDHFYNFRSFLQAGPYDWDHAAHSVTAQHGVNISQALHLMPKGLEKGHGWESLAAATHEKIAEYKDVLPMIWGTEKPSPAAVQRHLDLWDGRNHNHSHQILLSPNFGDAWYAYGKEFISVSRQWNTRISSCSANHMMTLLQNLMFVPTPLAYELHRERRALVLPEQETNAQNNTDVNRILTPAGLSTLPPYGAIHLRMNILNRDVYKMGVTKEQVVEGLKNCFATLAKETNADVQKWWLISDDVQVAQHVSSQLNNIYSFASSVVQQEGASANNAEEHLKLKVKGAHSGDAIKPKFGQKDMAPSVIDWMALHESHIALITHDSAYGETGARGKGKINAGTTCGGRVQKKRHSFPMFYIYKTE